MQPQMIKYLEQRGKCQKEPYYECIASHVDETEFNNCAKKCIPNPFSNMRKNYATTFCKNDTASQRCIFNHILIQGVGSNCKKSCSHVEYFGEAVVTAPAKHQSGYEKWNFYILKYKLTNQDFGMKLYEEYLIYDFIGMIGSVGGTLGMFNIF